MPQSSDEMRALMEKWFGDPVGDKGPMLFLQSRGYTLGGKWEWKLPTPSHTVSFEELKCIQFLIEEWDMGHISQDKHPVYWFQSRGA